MSQTPAQSRCEDGSLRLFVYGTLKKGCANHERFCTGATSLQAAKVRGRLYEHPGGFPILWVPQQDILAAGTGRPRADTATQAQYEGRLAALFGPSLAGVLEQAEWTLIRGQVLIFDDPESRLPALDEFEEYSPGQPGLYRRVLLSVMPDNGPMVPAWAYVAGVDINQFELLSEDHWPCP